MIVNNPHQILGLEPNAAPAQVKAAYHQKLREFPARTHPTEFKEIRAAYEALQQSKTDATKKFFTPGPSGVSIDQGVIEELKEKLVGRLAVSLEDMLRDTF
jgi:DnaJ-class molecular chaperone